jgi:hypothetical protein
MRIFSDGNVAIQAGGTFTNNGAKLQVNGNISISGNNYLDFGNGDSRIVNTGGILSFQTYTIGDFGTRMTITGPGNVGIGTATINASSGYKMLKINGVTTGGEIVLAGGEVEYGYMYASSGVFVIDALTSKPMRFRAGAQNRMEITSGGNVGIGTTSPTERLHLVNTTTGFVGLRLEGSETYAGTDWTIYASSSSPSSADDFLGFYNNSTADGATAEYKLRIFKNGNVGIGTASPDCRLHVNSGSLSQAVIVEATSAGGPYIEFRRSGAINGFIGNAGSVTGTNTDDIALRSQAGLRFSTGGNNLRMTIDSSGNIGAPTGTNIYNASDYRLKQNIETISNALDKISALNPVKFNWIDGFVPSEDGKDMLGFVAQEVYEVIPEAVESFGGNSIIVNDIEIENPLRVNEKFIIPVLVAAIQELKAKIEILEQS